MRRLARFHRHHPPEAPSVELHRALDFECRWVCGISRYGGVGVAFASMRWGWWSHVDVVVLAGSDVVTW